MLVGPHQIDGAWRRVEAFEQGRTTVARHHNFVHVPAVAPQTQRAAGAKGTP